jgi:hypothetical protein
MNAEVESEESFWLEREWIDREELIEDDLVPAAGEMLKFLESTIPAMFVYVGGRSYLLRKGELI